MGILVLLGALFLGFVILVLWFSWYTQPRPTRTLTDSLKIQAPRLRGAAREAAMEGQFIELGYDVRSHQPAILQETDRYLNAVNVGPTGAGKTSYMISTFLWRDIANIHNSVVVFDSQKDLTETVLSLCRQYRRDSLIFPDCGFNPLGGGGTASDRAGRFADIYAQANEIAGGASDYYSDIGELWLRKVIPLYESAYQQPMILREIIELAKSEARRERLLTDAAVCPESADYVLHFGNWRIAEYDRNLSGLISFVDRILVGSRAWLYNQRSAPTLESAIERQQVIVIREGGYRNTQDRTLGVLFMVALQDYIKHRETAKSPHLVAIYLDEAHLYFNANFPAFIATSRKKRATTLLGFQTFAQLVPFDNEITTNARTQIIHDGLQYQDVLRVAQNIGMREFEVTTVSHPPSRARQGVNESRSLDRDFLIQPEAIMHLGKDHVLVLSAEEREKKAPQLLRKPKPLVLALTPYTAPQVSPYPPQNVWDVQDAGTTGNQADSSPATPSTSAASPVQAGGSPPEPGQKASSDEPISIEQLRVRRRNRSRRRGQDEPPLPPRIPPDPPGRSPDWE